MGSIYPVRFVNRSISIRKRLDSLLDDLKKFNPDGVEIDTKTQCG